MNKYVEVIRDSDDEVVKRIDVTGSGERQVDRIVNGLNINLNHEAYSVWIMDSDKVLELIPKI